MLRLIPAPLHRTLYRIADRVRRRWWAIAKPQRRSVSVIAVDAQGRVLLVRHSYGRAEWTLPGGGISRREDALAAAVREFREELGCPLADVWPLAQEHEVVSGALDLQHVFAARLAGTPMPDMREVEDAQTFDPLALPPATGRIAAARIAAWRERAGSPERGA